MIEVRFHGRGGQGTVMASTTLALACHGADRYVQAFPLFGFERRGAPVSAFTRIDDKPIVVHCQVYNPDIVVILDSALVKVTDVTAGLKDQGWIILNSEWKPGHFGFPSKYRLATVDASGIALNLRLGSRATPIVNTAILGALIRVTGIVSLDAVVAAVMAEVPSKKQTNADAVVSAYNLVHTE